MKCSSLDSSDVGTKHLLYQEILELTLKASISQTVIWMHFLSLKERDSNLYTQCGGKSLSVSLREGVSMWDCVTESVCECVWGRVRVFLLQCWNKPPVMVGVGQGCFRAWTAPATSPYKEDGQKLLIFLKAKAPLCAEWVHTSVWPTEACSTPGERARIAHFFICLTVLPFEPDAVIAKGHSNLK